MMTSRRVHRCASPVSIKEGFAAGDGDVAGQHLEGGGFTGPVDSQQPETLPGHNGRRQLDTPATWPGLPVARAPVYLRFAGCLNMATLRYTRRLWCLAEEELDISLYTNTTTSKSTARANSAKQQLPTAFPPQQTSAPSPLLSPRHRRSQPLLRGHAAGSCCRRAEQSREHPPPPPLAPPPPRWVFGHKYLISVIRLIPDCL